MGRPPDEKPMLVVGVHAVSEAIRWAPDAVVSVLVETPENRAVHPILSEALHRGLKVQSVPAREFRMAVRDESRQRIAAWMRPFSYEDDEDLLERVLNGDAGLAVALDCVQDPQNLGSILRTCAYFGVVGVLLPRDRSVPITPAVIRASAGAAYRVPIAQVTNLSRTIRAWRERGVQAVGAVVRGGIGIADLRVERRCMLVLGSEHAGLRRLVRESCDGLVSIPSGTDFDSLNVGVAAGILIHAMSGGIKAAMR